MIDSQPSGRVPTSRVAAYGWHSEALAYYEKNGTLKGCVTVTPMTANDPQCGYYLRPIDGRYINGTGKINRDRRYVPASIRLEQVIDEMGFLIEPERLVCEVGGVRRDPLEEWGWLCGHPISQAEYMRLVAERITEF